MHTTGAATAIPATVHKHVTGQFAEASSPTARPQNGGLPSVQNPPPLEDIPKAPVRQGTPWPNAGLASENLFETRKDWPIPPTPVPTIKNRKTTQNCSNPACHCNAQTSHRKVLMGTTLPHLQNEEEHGEEDWDGNLQSQPRMHPQNHQPQTAQNPQPQDLQSHSHKPFKLKNKTFSNLSPSHKASSAPSLRTIKNHLMYQTGILNR